MREREWQTLEKRQLPRQAPRDHARRWQARCDSGGGDDSVLPRSQVESVVGIAASFFQTLVGLAADTRSEWLEFDVDSRLGSKEVRLRS